MADDRITLSGINWRDTCAFTHLFRTFRVAIHPSKLVLGLLLLLSLYLAVRLLDTSWPVPWRAVPHVVNSSAHWLTAGGNASFDDLRQSARQQVERNYANLLLEYAILESRDSAMRDAEQANRLGELKDAIKAKLAEDRSAIQTRYNEAQTAAEGIED